MGCWTCTKPGIKWQNCVKYICKKYCGHCEFIRPSIRGLWIWREAAWWEAHPEEWGLWDPHDFSWFVDRAEWEAGESEWKSWRMNHTMRRKERNDSE
jgi:hypothetical protein